MNRVGLVRAEVPEASRDAIASAFKRLYRSNEPLQVAIRTMTPYLARDPYVHRLLEFLKTRD